MSPRTVLALTLALVVLCAAPALAKTYTIKFSHVVAEDTPKGQAANYFKKIVEKRTDGQVEVEVYPNAALYGDREAIEALHMNAIQMACPSFSKFTGFVPELQIFDLPFLFQDREHLYAFMDSSVGQELLKMVTEKGLLGLSYWDNGFKQLTLDSNAIKVPEDVQGKKFRIMSSKVLEAQFEAVDASPQVLPFSEVYSALQQGVVDGQENTISNIYTKKFHEVQNYLTLSDHGYLGYMLVTNQMFWNSLPEDLQKTVQSCVEDATEFANEKAAELNQQQLQKIRESGSVEIHDLTKQQRKQWVEEMRDIYPEFYDVIGKQRIQKAIELGQ
jgi:C4-dicarboxylate-binding protein DctP